MLNNQKELILNHLLECGLVNWMIALNRYGIGGGFRMRISELRKIFKEFGINLNDRKIKNTQNEGYHFEYYLTIENKELLRKNYYKVLKKLSPEKEKQLQIF